MNPVLVVPYDESAEREVIGCAVGTDTGYRIAAGVVVPADFYVPRHRRLFTACADLGDVEASWNSADRIHLAAEAADVPESVVRALVDDRGRFHDVHAEYARRVAEAARRRRVMAAAAEAFALLGEGAGVEDALRPLLPFVAERAWAA